MIENVRPRANYVLLTTLEEAVPGLTIPASVRYRENTAAIKGTIVAVGPGKQNCQPEVAVGDTVVYNDRRGIDVILGPEVGRLISEDDILAVL